MDVERFAGSSCLNMLSAVKIIKDIILFDTFEFLNAVASPTAPTIRDTGPGLGLLGTG